MLIRRNITYKENELIIPLYLAIATLHLEYCLQAWRPYRKKGIGTLERIQRRATKIIPELRNFRYEKRLKEYDLTTLETMRLREDHIELSTYCINARSVNMFKNKVDIYLRKAGYISMKHVGFSISQWLPCPLTIWVFALDDNLVTFC